MLDREFGEEAPLVPDEGTDDGLGAGIVLYPGGPHYAALNLPI